jgi:hypothetical protein
MSGTALFTFFFFFFFFFFVHSAASPAGITMFSCLLLRSIRCLSSWHLNVQLSLALTVTRIKRVGNNTKLACASGR